MRDPNRISGLAERLENAWSYFPDLRLGQLIVNAVGTDPFFIEDDKLIDAVEDLISRMRCTQ